MSNFSMEEKVNLLFKKFMNTASTNNNLVFFKNQQV